MCFDQYQASWHEQGDTTTSDYIGGNTASVEEPLTRVVDSMGEQNERASIRMNAVQHEQFILREKACGRK